MTLVMLRANVFYVDLEPSAGREANKRRPCVIVSNDANNRAATTVTIVPITGSVERVHPFEARLDTELDQPCKVQAHQVRTLSKMRLLDAPIARSSRETMVRIDEALRLHVKLYLPSIVSGSRARCGT